MTARRSHPAFLAFYGFAATLGLLGAVQARAQVIQVADDGSVRTSTGAGIVS